MLGLLVHIKKKPPSGQTLMMPLHAHCCQEREETPSRLFDNLWYKNYSLLTVAGSGVFSIISQLLLNYFSVISRIFPVSCLFFTYFLPISQLFLASHLFLNHFSFISQLFTRYFPFLNQRSRDVHVTFALIEWYHVFTMDEVCFFTTVLKLVRYQSNKPRKLKV